MQHLKDLGAIISLAALYFGMVYFAVSALAPSLALQAAFIAAALALFVYLGLVIIRREEEGLPAVLLYMAIPALCLTAGVIWWLMKLTGFWDAIR